MSHSEASATGVLGDPVTVDHGGTGQVTLTDGAFVIGNGTNPVTMIGPLTDGQIPIGSTVGIDPVPGTITQPAAGITVTNGPGSITLGLANDLAAVEGLGTTGITVRNAANNWVTRTITSSDASVTIANPSGIAGDIDLIVTNPLVVPLTVPEGGTGLITITDHGIMVGSGVGAITPIAVGNTGELIVGSTGADPAFSTSATGDFTFTSATAGATRTFTVSNTDNTNAASTAVIVASTGGASAGDAKFQATTNTTTWSWGVDNSVTVPTADTFVISQNAALGTNNIMSAATSGEINYPLQPAFLAYLGSDQLNKTGNFTEYYLGTAALTEVFDQNSDFNVNGTFTAPVTGKYVLFLTVEVKGCTISTGGYTQIVTSNRTYTFVNQHGATNLNLGISGSNICDMDAADTAQFLVVGHGEAGNTDDITGNAQIISAVSGYLFC